jgi:hypothetical protein
MTASSRYIALCTLLKRSESKLNPKKVEQLTRIPTSAFPVEQATEYALYASLRRLPLPQVQAPDDIR